MTPGMCWVTCQNEPGTWGCTMSKFWPFSLYFLDRDGIAQQAKND